MKPHVSPPVFKGRLHDARTATSIGRWLGATFLVCFATGLISHFMQHPPDWLSIPSRPVWGYRLSQGLHIASGIAAIPLLLAKLWTVYPRLFTWPPVTSLRHALERLSVALLVAGALFQLATGLLNTAQWYPWTFSFVPAHYAVAWLVTGALLLHLAVKAPEIRAHWSRNSPATLTLDDPDRRSLLRAVAAAVGAVTLTTVGQTVTPLKSLALFAPRHPDHGPQSLPVNRTAAQAGVGRVADEEYRLVVTGPRPYTLTLAELRALPQHEAELPIACVEGWSRSARWTGVRTADLLDRAGAPPNARVRVVSLQLRGGYRVSELAHTHARDPLTLLALRLNGEDLHPDHGYPARLIAPNRPGVLQTKWVGRLEVLS
ncbi:molybdopterin-dependent oxidoreductase [Streptomyces acidiscabies]|uniref:Molybdopterin-dependent oxidoreductase n=1 Tax=Streptomyces acidiscabies TaxID=42234 RepID=A0AAP6BKY6_9ACTN|nr:molybdopterin-dependent oxidoreductase [Streptomyces acidiscabies]MBP5942810.1 molybdopterin-dependent oxidoreductase [Streptomyces sp. LBUM 1476]MBZ3918093.1 molybdopterin-dependent oxidoreductase [Streptomyces acidiscabies]MDX2966535.1 molybdopterin-dependent oxidoreductase [Streptomyces acidiscabies]MDX3021951.1 molybdopterin-dependent oxidoreductase [Streptomyces acidiscabies]MDX3789608.1 molybdopterin-dependent oxidoreductase [Streptomyces acidiscabies]